MSRKLRGGAAADQPALRDDLLIGSKAIGAFLGWKDRRVLYFNSLGKLPIIKGIDGQLMARKSQLARRLSAPEAA